MGILVLLVASNVYLFTQIEHLKTESKNEMARLSADLNNSVQQLRIESSASVQHSRQTVDELQAQLREQRRAAERQVGQAKIEAQKKVETLEAKVAAEQQQEQQAIQQVKQTADTATTKIADVSTDVGTVEDGCSKHQEPTRANHSQPEACKRRCRQSLQLNRNKRQRIGRPESAGRAKLYGIQHR